jgi:hypothetical protein
MEDGYKLNMKHLQFFKKACTKWRNKLGLGHWQALHYFAEGDFLAATVASNENTLVHFQLSQEWPFEPTNKRIEGAAKHEAIELLIYPLWDLARDRWSNERELETERHRIVRKLETILS